MFRGTLDTVVVVMVINVTLKKYKLVRGMISFIDYAGEWRYILTVETVMSHDSWNGMMYCDTLYDNFKIKSTLASACTQKPL